MRLMAILALVGVAGKSDGGDTCADYATIKYVSRDSAP